jgi:hypothetical protein
MKICEIICPNKILSIEEYATGGATSSGNIANYVGGIGGPMLGTIRRMPPGQSFFGPAGTTKSTMVSKKKKKTHKSK